MIISLSGHTPEISGALFIADNASIVGDVALGKNASVWYNAVLRGDENSITIGNNSNIQDNCTVHVTRDRGCEVGDDVSVGHNAVLHACTIRDNCIIGMNAAVLTGAVIGSGSIVAAGSVVKEGTVVPPNSLVAGVPAVVKKRLDSPTIQGIINNARDYVELARAHSQSTS